MSNVIVFGCGNIDRGDDAAGILVVRELQRRAIAGVEIIEIGGDPLRMLNLWPGMTQAIVIDAMVTGAPAGTVHEFSQAALHFEPESFVTSTHGFSVRETIQLARVLEHLPAELTVFGIEGVRFEHGATASPEVIEAVNRLADRLAEAAMNRSAVPQEAV